MSFHLDVTNWLINTIPPDNFTLWTKPVYPGYPDVDLANPNLRFAAPGAPPPINAPPAMAPPATMLQPVTTLPPSIPTAQYPPGTTVPLR